VGEDLRDEQRIFDTSDDLDVATAAFADLDVDVKTRFRRCSQVMAARRLAGV
jgi:hypothetical protein